MAAASLQGSSISIPPPPAEYLDPLDAFMTVNQTTLVQEWNETSIKQAADDRAPKTAVRMEEEAEHDAVSMVRVLLHIFSMVMSTSV